MKNFYYLIAFLILSATLSSCEVKQETEFTNLPFLENDGGRWGLIGTDGKILFSNEFKEKPSVAINGLFVVKNDNGLYDYYTAQEQPKFVSGPYLQAGLFYESVAPVVEKESPISFINKDGSEAFTISEYNGSQIISATNFSEGLAMIVDANSLCGYINTKGEVIIKPRYSQAFAFKEGFAVVSELNSSSDLTRSIIDKTGKTILNIDNSVSSVHECFSDGLLGFTDDPQMQEWGFMNIKGEKIIKPNSKFVSVQPFNNGFAIFFDGNGYGIIDKAGEIQIRAKYKDIQYADNNLFFANDNDKYGLINAKDEKITDFIFDSFTGFYNGKCFVLERNKYLLIDKKGKYVNKNDYTKVVNDYHPDIFESDFFNVATEVKRVIKSVTAYSIDNLSLEALAGEMFNKFNYPSKESLRGSNIMKDNIGTSNIQIERIVEFTSSLSTPVKKRAFKRDMWGRGYYQDEIVGWNFADNARVKSIKYNITLLNKAAGKSKQIAEAIRAMAKSNGAENLITESETENKLTLILKQ